jgi:hypothetical protein
VSLNRKFVRVAWQGIGSPFSVRDMRISGEATIGIILGLIGAAGIGIPMVLPAHPEAGWIFIGVAVIGAILLGAHHLYYALPRAGQPRAKRKMIAVVGMMISSVGFFGFAGAYFWPHRGSDQGVSRFHGEIKGMAAFNVDGQTGLLNVIPVVDIRGTEGDSTITEFSLMVLFSDGEKSEVLAQPVFDRVSFRGPNNYVDVTPDNTLWGRDGAPVIHGFRSGRIWFAFHDISNTKKISHLDTKLTLRISESNGASSSSSIRLRDIIGPRIVSPDNPLTISPPGEHLPSPVLPTSPTGTLPQ